MYLIAALLLASAAPPVAPPDAVSTAVTPPLPGSPRIPPATIDNTLEVTGETLAAQSIRTRMTVGVTIAGGGPFRFLVDSGADRTVIGAALARRLQLSGEGRVTLHGMAGASEVDTVRLAGLRVGATDIAPINAPSLPEQHIGAQGLLGIDALAGQRLLLDFEKTTITVQDTRMPEPRAAAQDEVVVVARRRRGQLILTQASAGRGGLYAVIDSGSDITVANSALRRRIFGGRRPPQTTEIRLTSVTGEDLMADLLILPELKLGGVTLQNVPMAFVDAPPFRLFGIDQQPAILLGTDVLRAFRRVSLDFRNRRVRFTLRR